MRKRSGFLRSLGLIALMTAAACGKDVPSQFESIESPAVPARKDVTPGANWTVSVDGGTGPFYLSNPFTSSLDTVWFTISDGSSERFDASSSMGCEYTTYLYCSSITKLQGGGYKAGLIISVPFANQQGQFRAFIQRSDFSKAYSAWVTYRMSAVNAATLSISPLTPSLAYGTTRQMTASAYDAWSRPINSLFPPTYSSSNTNIGTINTTGLFTATGCGTTTIRADYNDGFATPNVQTVATVTCSNTIRVSSNETPLTRLVGEFNYSVTVGRYDLSGTFLGNITPTASIGNASIATVGSGASSLTGVSAGSTTLSLAYPGAPPISVPVNVIAISLSGPASLGSGDTGTFTASLSGPGGPYTPSYWTNGEEGGASQFTSCAGQWSCTTTGSAVYPGQAIYLTVSNPSGMQFRKGIPVSVP